MDISEIVIIGLVYSGLLTYFLVPFQRRAYSTNKKQEKFVAVFRDNLKRFLFHKKAILALLFFILSLAAIWQGYDAAEYHTNAHSGYPPIGTNGKAFVFMNGVFLYTVILYIFLAFVRTLKVVKNE